MKNKKQKTLHLHPGVERLIQAYADKKGTTFQRVIQAAVLNYFFEEPGGPDDSWITVFVCIEKELCGTPRGARLREAERKAAEIARELSERGREGRRAALAEVSVQAACIGRTSARPGTKARSHGGTK